MQISTITFNFCILPFSFLVYFSLMVEYIFTVKENDHFVYLSYHRENLTGSFVNHEKRQSFTIQSKVASAFKDLYRVLDLLLEKFGTVFDSINSNGIIITLVLIDK